MARYFHIVALLFAVVLCQAQTGNVFDIPERLSPAQDVDSVAVEPPQTGTTNNSIFDVRPASSTTSVQQNTSRQQVPLEEPQVVQGDNPFNVDHVPIRRRTLQQQDTSITATRQVPLGPELAPRSVLFIFFIEMVCLILLALVLNTQRGFIKKLWKSLTNENILKLSQRDHNASRNPVYVMLYAIFLSNAAAFAFLVIRHFGGSGGIKLWFQLFAAVSVLYTGRHLFLAVFAAFFPLKKGAMLYSFTIMTYNIAIGLLLIPVNMMLAFGPDSFFSPTMYIGIALIASALILRYLRGFTISLPYLGTHPFHFLLYICTTEIAPILLILRFVSRF